MAIEWKQLHGDAFVGAKVLVTGGAGFIGSHLCEALGKLGAKVLAFDDLSGGYESNLAGMAGVEMVKGSILDNAVLSKSIAGCKYVLHQGALGSVPRSVAEPRLFHDVNVTGTLNVLEAARAAGVSRLAFAASSSAYGDSETLPKIETMPTHAKSPYAANKIADEAMMSAYASSYGLDTASLRYFNIFGPRQSANNAYAAVIAAFAKALLAGERPVIYGDGEQSRDFTYIDNVVHANLLALKSPRPIGGAAINVACGRRISVTQLANKIAEIVGRPELTPIYKPERAGDVKHSLADLSRAKTLLGYDPITHFDDGLAKTMAWYREQNKN